MSNSQPINYEYVTVEIFGTEYECEVIGTYYPPEPAEGRDPGSKEEYDIEAFIIASETNPRVCINELLNIPDVYEKVISQLKRD